MAGFGQSDYIAVIPHRRTIDQPHADTVLRHGARGSVEAQQKIHRAGMVMAKKLSAPPSHNELESRTPCSPSGDLPGKRCRGALLVADEILKLKSAIYTYRSHMFLFIANYLASTKIYSISR
jgi:hypothetical protein